MTKEAFVKIFPTFSEKYDGLDKLVRLVEEKAKVVNITAIRTYDDIWQKHIVDSLIPTQIPEVEEVLLKEGTLVLDVGTGGGFPGLPLAITHPNSNFTLLDGTNKKVLAIDEFVAELAIKNVQTVWERSEKLAKGNDYLKKYDIVLARSLAYLPELLEILIPFAKKNGLVIAYKNNDEQEIEAGNTVSSRLGLKLRERYVYQDNTRAILVYYQL